MNPQRRLGLIGLAAGPLFWWTVVRIAAGQDKARRVIELRIEKRKVVSPKQPIRVLQRELIELRVTSDEFVELHVHGYDKELQARPDKPGVLIFEAYATGRFPVTSHRWGRGGHGHDALTYFEVYPR